MSICLRMSSRITYCVGPRELYRLEIALKIIITVVTVPNYMNISLNYKIRLHLRQSISEQIGPRILRINEPELEGQKETFGM